MIRLVFIICTTCALPIGADWGPITLMGPTNTLAEHGKSKVTLYCRFVGQNGASRPKDDQLVKWLKNGQPLDIVSPKYSITGNPSTERNLEIHKLSWSDSGEYTCTSTLGVYSVSARLLVADKPICDIKSAAPQVELTCFTKYSGDWAPRLTLKGDGKTLVTRPQSTSSSLVTTPGHKNSSTYTCTLEAFREDILYGNDRLVGQIPEISNKTGCANCDEEQLMSLTCTKTAARPSAELRVSEGYPERNEKREIGSNPVFKNGMYLWCETPPTGFWDITTEWIIPGSPGRRHQIQGLELEPWMSGSYITCNITTPLGSSLASTTAPVTVLDYDDLVRLHAAGYNSPEDDADAKDRSMTDEHELDDKGYGKGDKEDDKEHWKRKYYDAAFHRYDAEWREGQLKRHLVIVSSVLGSLVLLGVFIFLVMAHGMRKLYIRLQAIEGKDTLLTSSGWRLLLFRTCIWVAGRLACLAKKSAEKLSRLEKSAEAKMTSVENQLLLEQEQAKAVDGPHRTPGSPGENVSDGNGTPTLNVASVEENTSPAITV